MATQTATLNTGHPIPLLGLGCWMGAPGKEGENQECYDMVLAALAAGYRHLDTAFGYGNEEAVGRAIKDSGIPRSELFVTTKLTGSDHGSVQAGFEKSLAALDCDYIDLYLMHWPQASIPWGAKVAYGDSPTFVETWAAMGKLLEGGKVRSIGVSNFSVKNLEVLLKETDIVPAVNQVEGHPYLPQMSLHKYCLEKGIHLTAYSPLGQPPNGTGISPILADEEVKAVAGRNGKPEGTVVLSWAIQRGNWSVIPKSSNPKRMKSNMDIITLPQDDFTTISNLHKQAGKLQHLCDYRQGDIMQTGEIFGWSLAEMGWEKMD